MRNKEIFEAVKEKGICESWAAKLRDASDEELASMFFDGSDWAFENDIPSKEMFKGYPGIYKHGLHLDESGIYKNPGKLAFFGKCTSVAEISGFEVSEIYLRHESFLRVEAKDNCFVVVTIADDAVLEVFKEEKATVIVYSYSGEVLGNPNKIVYKRYER